MTNTALATNYGLEWNALAYSGGEVEPITHMAFGDGSRIPAGGETELENEVFRQTISDHGQLRDKTGAFFDAPIPIGIGGFVIREVGLFTADNKLVAIGRLDPPLPVNKAFDFTYQFIVFFTRLEALVVEIDPAHGVTANRTINTGTGLSGGGDLSSDRTLVTDWRRLPRTTSVRGDFLINVRFNNSQHAVAFDDIQYFFKTRREEIQDIVAAYLKGQGISVVYDDAGNALTLEVGNASETKRGIVELANWSETLVGRDRTRAVTPYGLTRLTATQDRKGLVELASEAEVLNGADEDVAVTPRGLHALQSTTGQKGLVELSTAEELVVGKRADVAVTPAILKRLTATLTRAGLVRTASSNEVTTGADEEKYVSPATLKAWAEHIKSQTEVGAVGTYALAWYRVAATVKPGKTVSGSNLKYAGTYTQSSLSGYYSSMNLLGTWRCMGACGFNGAHGADSQWPGTRTTLWYRIR